LALEEANTAEDIGFIAHVGPVIRASGVAGNALQHPPTALKCAHFARHTDEHDPIAFMALAAMRKGLTLAISEAWRFRGSWHKSRNASKTP